MITLTDYLNQKDITLGSETMMFDLERLCYGDNNEEQAPTELSITKDFEDYINKHFFLDIAFAFELGLTEQDMRQHKYRICFNPTNCEFTFSSQNNNLSILIAPCHLNLKRIMLKQSVINKPLNIEAFIFDAHNTNDPNSTSFGRYETYAIGHPSDWSTIKEIITGLPLEDIIKVFIDDDTKVMQLHYHFFESGFELRFFTADGMQNTCLIRQGLTCSVTQNILTHYEHLKQSELLKAAAYRAKDCQYLSEKGLQTLIEQETEQLKSLTGGIQYHSHAMNEIRERFFSLMTAISNNDINMAIHEPMIQLLKTLSPNNTIKPDDIQWGYRSTPNAIQSAEKP